MEHRWRKAGGAQAVPFTPDAINTIAQYSRGIPRVINAISDNALIHAFGESNNMVQDAHVMEACSDLDLVPRTYLPEPVIVSAPVTAPPPANGLRTMERYNDTAAKRSFLNRWANKLGLA